MGRLFRWLVGHEKLVAASTLALVAALGLQLKFCRPRAPEALRLGENGTRAPETRAAPEEASAVVAGTWEMSVEKRKGGAEVWTLTLAQEGETLKGSILSAGGDLPVEGTLRGRALKLSAKKMGVTVDFPATFDGEKLEGTMRVLTINRRWTARRR